MQKPDPDLFRIKEINYFGEKMFLVTPKEIDIRWTSENMIYRSSMWDENWNPVSLGFKKFFNWDERPDLNPPPRNYSGVAVEKIDGSLLIVSKRGNRLISRTRGNPDARMMLNGYEVGLLEIRYKAAFHNEFIDNRSCSILYEWVSPNNRIILKYNQPDIYLVGCINNEDYSYWTQNELDNLGKQLSVKRPRTFPFDSLREMKTAIKEMRDFEGVCFYYNNGQSIRKIKSSDYLKRHAFKSKISFRNILDFWLDFGKPDLSQFQECVTNNFDFECWLMAKPIAEEIMSIYDIVCNQINEIEKVTKQLKQIERKTAAEQILLRYNKTPYTCIAFMTLDNKPITDKNFRKLISIERGACDEPEKTT